MEPGYLTGRLNDGDAFLAAIEAYLDADASRPGVFRSPPWFGVASDQRATESGSTTAPVSRAAARADSAAKYAAQSAVWSRAQALRGAVPFANGTRMTLGQRSVASPPLHGSIHASTSPDSWVNGGGLATERSRLMIFAHTGIAVSAAGRPRLRGVS